MANFDKHEAPGSNGYASIHICPNCGKQVVKTQAVCPYCQEKIFPEEDFAYTSEKPVKK